MAYLKAAVVMTFGVYFKVTYGLQSFSNWMICSCKISTDKCVALSLCNNRASCCPLMYTRERIQQNSWTFIEFCSFPPHIIDKVYKYIYTTAMSTPDKQFAASSIKNNNVVN